MSPTQPLNLTQSQELLAKARQTIPVQAQTFSKAPYYFVEGVYPVYVDSGQGCRITDVDGNIYIDYILGLGPLVLGYQHPKIDEAIRQQLSKGITFSLSHRLEVELAERLCDLIPSAEQVRYVKTGSDGCSAAIRAARAYTGRNKIAYCGYHGWHDWYAITTDLNAGIPSTLNDYVCPFTYNDLDSLQAIFDQYPGEIAAVSLEPILLDDPQDGFLQKVKELAHANGALLIFDEIITGFRYALGGAQERYGVVPDLSVFGKALGNGMPIGAVVGRSDIMSQFENIFVSTTFGGEALSLAAALATIDCLENDKHLEQLWESGTRLQNGFNDLANQVGIQAACIGQAPRMKIEIYDQAGNDDTLAKSLLMQETIRRGILFHPGIVYPMAVHMPTDIDQTLSACEAGLQTVKKAIEQDNIAQCLDGKPAGQVFARIPGAKEPSNK